MIELTIRCEGSGKRTSYVNGGINGSWCCYVCWQDIEDCLMPEHRRPLNNDEMNRAILEATIGD